MYAVRIFYFISNSFDSFPVCTLISYSLKQDINIKTTMLSIAARVAQAAGAMVAQDISHLLWYKIATTKRTNKSKTYCKTQSSRMEYFLGGILNLSTSLRNKHHKRGD